MKAVWTITIDDYLKVIEMAKANGKTMSDSMEEEFLQYMKEKGQKPSGHTELNKEELVQELISKNKNVLDITSDEKGKPIYKFYKKDDSSS